jgi:hypothetical protein
MKARSKRRRISRKAAAQLTLLQSFREQIKALAPLVPYHRALEHEAIEGLIEQHQDALLDGANLSNDEQAIRAIKSVGAFKRSVQLAAMERHADD